jgi:hypothetical protein
MVTTYTHDRWSRLTTRAFFREFAWPGQRSEDKISSAIIPVVTVLRSDMHFVCVLIQHNMLLFLEMDDIHSLVG